MKWLNSPLYMHMATSTKADQVFKLICFLVPRQSESSEGFLVMYNRPISKLCAGLATVLACLIVARPSRSARCAPAWAVVFDLPTAPKFAILAPWRLLGKPLQSTRIATEAIALCDLIPTNAVRPAATFTSCLWLFAVSLAGCPGIKQVSARYRTGFLSLVRLFACQIKRAPAHDAHRLSWRCTSGAIRNRFASSEARSIDSYALFRAQLLALRCLVRSQSDQCATDDTVCRSSGSPFHGFIIPQNKHIGTPKDNESHAARTRRAKRVAAGQLEIEL